MTVRALVSLAAVLCVTGAIATACDGANGPGTPGDTPSTVPAATIEGDLFIDPVGYQVTIPNGWTADDNVIIFGGRTTDAFYSTEKVGDIQTNIAITCEQLPPGGATLDEFSEQYLSTLAELATLDQESRSGPQIDGHDSMLITYRLEREDRDITKHELLTVVGRCAWTVSLLRATAASSESEPVFDDLVRSIRFQ